jgi:hypothetical protein
MLQRHHVVGCLLGIAFLVSCSPEKRDSGKIASSKAIITAEDHSLALDDYVRMGMPSPERMWTPQDYERAGNILKVIAERDAHQLPRYASATSGKMFERITSRENLAAMLNENLPLEARVSLMVGYMENINPILLVYFKPSNRGINFDAEIVEIMGLILDLAQKSTPLAIQFMKSIPENDPRLAVRKEGFSKMNAGLVTTFEGAIESMGESNFYRPSARLKLCGFLRTSLPPIISSFPPLVQKEFSLRLEKLREQEDDKEIKNSLAELRKAVDLLTERH